MLLKDCGRTDGHTDDDDGWWVITKALTLSLQLRWANKLIYGYDQKTWHLTACKFSFSLSFLNWIKNETIFHHISKLMLANINLPGNLYFLRNMEPLWSNQHRPRSDYRIYPRYWDTLSTNHTSPIIWNSPYYYLLMCLKYCCMYGKV